MKSAPLPKKWVPESSNPLEASDISRPIPFPLIVFPLNIQNGEPLYRSTPNPVLLAIRLFVKLRLDEPEVWTPIVLFAMVLLDIERLTPLAGQMPVVSLRIVSPERFNNDVPNRPMPREVPEKLEFVILSFAEFAIMVPLPVL